MRPEVIALFRDVVDLLPEARADLYAKRDVSETLRTEVESLLSYDAKYGLNSDTLQGCLVSAEHRLLDDPPAEDEPEPEPEPEPSRKVTIPEKIGRFPVERLLGRGGMGDVYLGRDPVIDRPVAIKLIRSGLDDESARRRLVREARTAGRLRHPNIVTVFEAGEHEDAWYIAMEYVPGETLGKLIRRREPLPLQRRIEMIEGACAGLAHAHRAGVIHLDIKPDNLMVDDGGIVKVLDFGISRSLHAETLVTVQVAGTLRYMSPEQMSGRRLDHRSDVFSLGCALFELVTYEPAFDGSTGQIVSQIARGPVPRLEDRWPNVNPDLARIVSRAMAHDAAGRYDDLEDLRADLARVRATIDPALVVVPLSTPRPHEVTPSRPLWRRTAIAAGVGAAVLAGAAILTWGPSMAPGAGAPVTPGVVDVRPVPESAPAAGAAEPQAAAGSSSGLPGTDRQPAPTRDEPSGSNGRPADTTRAPLVTSAPAPAAAGSPPPSPPDSVTPPPVAQEETLAATQPPVVLVVPGAPVAERSAPPAASPVAVAPDPQAVIRETLRRYEAAYESLDVGALLRVFPRFAQEANLRKSFAGLSKYEMDLRVTRIDVNGDDATAAATISRRMSPRVGAPQNNDDTTEFRLRRSGEEWLIVSATPR